MSLFIKPTGFSIQIMQSFIKYFKLFFAVVVSLPFLTAFMQSDELAEGVNSAKMFYFYFISIIIALFVCVGFIIKSKRLKISVNKLDILLLIFWFYNFLRLIFTPNILITNDRFIIFTILIALYFIWKEVLRDFKFNKFSPSYILIAAFLLVGFCQCLIGVFQVYNIFGFYSTSFYRVTGTFGNPGPFSGYLITIIPFAFGLYLFITEKSVPSIILKYLGLITFLAGFLVLSATTIRGGWLAASAGIGYLLIIKYEVLKRIKEFLSSKFKKIVFISVLCIISAASFYYLFNIKPDSAFGRILIWKVSYSMVKENPVFGLGYDTFSAKYNIYQAEYFAEKGRSENEILVAGNNKWAFNEFIEILVEIGIIGLVFFIIIFSCVFIKNKPKININEIDETNDNYVNKECLNNCIRASVISTLIFACTGYPFKILPTLLNTIYILSLFSANLSSVKVMIFPKTKLEENYSSYLFLGKLFYISLVITVCSIFINEQLKNFKSYLIWKQAESNSSSQNYNEAIKQYSLIYPYLKNNGNFLLNYGGTLSLAGHHKKAVKILKECKKLNSEPNVFISLGKSYEALDKFDLALLSYKQAADIKPVTFYPKYILVKLFLKTGNKTDAISVAKSIFNSKIKINSPAIREIKNEVKNLIETPDNPVIINNK